MAIKFPHSNIILLCRIIRVALIIYLAVELFFFILTWSTITYAAGPWTMEVTPNGLDLAAMQALSNGQRLLGMALGLPALLLTAYGALRLARMLGGFERSAIFELDTIGHLRAFAGAVFLATGASIIEPAVRGLALRMLGQAHGRITIGISSDELTLILMCGLFYLIAAMMHEARRLAEENEAFV